MLWVVALTIILAPVVRVAILAWMVWRACKRADEATLRLMRSWKQY